MEEGIGSEVKVECSENLNPSVILEAISTSYFFIDNKIKMSYRILKTGRHEKAPL